MTKENLYDLGAELFEKEKFAEAIKVLLKAYTQDSNDVDVIILLAGCYINITHFTEAARWLLVADKIDDKNPMVKYNLGYALLCMGRVSDAMKYIKECLQLNPSPEINEMAKRMLKTEEYFKEKLENNCNISLEEEFECDNKFRKAQEYLYTNHFKEAIALYKSILEKKPFFYRAIQNIGVCHIQDGKPEEALEYLEKALSISPKDELCLGNIAHVHHLLGNLEKSKKYSEKVMNVVKEPLLRDMIRLVTLFIDIGEFKFARELLRKYSNLYDNAQLTFLSGVLYAQQKEYSAAKKEFQKITDVSNAAKEYLEKTDQIIKKKINGYNFKPKIAINASEDMI